jgi:hypothetical protein
MKTILVVLSTFIILGCSSTIIKKEFTHPVSSKKIYYKGASKKNDGQYYINNNGKKQIILESYFRYGPWIQWYGEYVAGIVVSSANIYSLYFYDLKNNKLSKEYSFIIYIDEDKNNVICAADGCLIMYNIFTNTLVKEFEFDEPLIYDHFDEELGEDLYYKQLYGQNQLSHLDNYDIKKPDEDTLIIRYNLSGTVELKGEFVYKY